MKPALPQSKTSSRLRGCPCYKHGRNTLYFLQRSCKLIGCSWKTLRTIPTDAQQLANSRAPYARVAQDESDHSAPSLANPFARLPFRLRQPIVQNISYRPWPRADSRRHGWRPRPIPPATLSHPLSQSFMWLDQVITRQRPVQMMTQPFFRLRL